MRGLTPRPDGTVFDVVGIGNALVDIISHVEDGFIDEHGLVKGAMTLVDTDRALALHRSLGTSVEMSGGSAANTVCGVASLGGRAAYIGKVSDEESELPHAILGMKLAEKAGERPDVLNAIGAHHDEIEMTSLISPIVQVCDAISGARPGARREVVESYIQRLKDLENIALEQPGVTQSYAIQAGRELRVMVESDQVNDEMAEQISFNISQRIMNEMTYPGQVKVTVIRETRAVSVAK